MNEHDNMSAHLIYVMGPSGAGKDSVLGWVRQQLGALPTLHWARRTITRRADAGGEEHEAVTFDEYARDLAAGCFALAWRANGRAYGIRHRELAPLTRGEWVVVNGSRGWFPVAQSAFPGLVGVHITAAPEILRQRLIARGRETPEEIEARVARATAYVPPPGLIEIRNDGALADAGQALLTALRQLPDWPG